MKRLFVLLLSVLVLIFNISAQSIKELEARKKKALENLATTTKLLQETQKSKKGTVNQINLLKHSIKQSNEIISTLNGEIALLDTNIDSLHQEKTSLEERLSKVKKEYAKMVEASYYQRRYFSPLLFIFSSDDFSQAYRRYRYLQEMTQYRKDQALLIEQLSVAVSEKENQLFEDKLQKETAVSAKAREASRLEYQNKKQSEMLAQLKQKESDLKQQQKKQQRQADQLNEKIQQQIAAEIKRQNDKKQQKNTSDKSTTTTTASSSTHYSMSKEEQLVAGNFEKNKGRLPLPVERGFISGHYGVQPHPVLDKVTINNKGVYLQAPAGTDARAIFEGEVTQIFSVQGSNSAVIIKHGNYRTVYSNLTAIYVKVGDKVKTKQKVGRIYTDSENDNKTELYLMIYKNTEIQNPERWLAL